MLPFTSDAGSVDAKPLSSSRPSVNVVLILILLALSYTCLNLARELHATKADATAQIEALVLSHEMLRSSVTKMNAAHTAARPEVAPAPPLESPLSPSSSSSTSTASLLALEKEIASLKKVADKIPSMKADLQRLSRDFLSIAFPNYDSIFVHLYVAFSHNDPPDSEPQLIKIKLATSEMPYTSLFFIQQIQAGIWDGGHFHRNAVHVLQADPFQGNPVGGRRKVFQDQGLYSVSFQEYNPLFPHVQYTIGLAGKILDRTVSQNQIPDTLTFLSHCRNPR